MKQPKPYCPNYKGTDLDTWLTEEWLQDIADTLWLKAGCPNRYHSNDPEGMKLCGKREVLGQLIDELKKQKVKP